MNPYQKMNRQYQAGRRKLIKQAVKRAVEENRSIIGRSQIWDFLAEVASQEELLDVWQTAQSGPKFDSTMSAFLRELDRAKSR